MESDLLPPYREACFPITMIWERINHAYSSDSPPTNWGLKKGEFGFQSWFFSSHNERYTVVWDAKRSYWKIQTPFDDLLFFLGPLFIDHSRKGLNVPPIFNVINSENEFLLPASATKIASRMLQIVRYVNKPSKSQVPNSSTAQQ